MKLASSSRTSFGPTLLMLPLLAGCSSGQTDSAEYLWPGDEWSISTPEAQGINAAAIDSLVADIGAGVYVAGVAGADTAGCEDYSVRCFEERRKGTGKGERGRGGEMYGMSKWLAVP